MILQRNVLQNRNCQNQWENYSKFTDSINHHFLYSDKFSNHLQISITQSVLFRVSSHSASVQQCKSHMVKVLFSFCYLMSNSYFSKKDIAKREQKATGMQIKESGQAKALGAARGWTDFQLLDARKLVFFQGIISDLRTLWEASLLNGIRRE